MLYVIQRMDVEAFGLAEDIVPEYAKSLQKAIKHTDTKRDYSVMFV